MKSAASPDNGTLKIVTSKIQSTVAIGIIVMVAAIVLKCSFSRDKQTNLLPPPLLGKQYRATRKPTTTWTLPLWPPAPLPRKHLRLQKTDTFRT